MQLQELTAQFDDVSTKGDLRIEVAEIRYDSRQVGPGDLFVALKGEKTDGARFINDAISRGAVAIASDHDIEIPPGCVRILAPDARAFLAAAARILYRDPAAGMKLVAITGTNGKTTTSYLVSAIQSRAGFRACIIGTLGMHIGAQAFASAHTTPEASDLTAFLHKASLEGCTHGAVEVSSHALVQKRVHGTHFEVGVFTNLTPEHLDFHVDMESYYAAKRLLFTSEGANNLQSAVINLDDPYGRRLARESSMPARGYGFAADADYRVLESRTGIGGTHLRMAIPNGEITIDTPLVGRPNIYNIMAATGAALELGIAPEAIRSGIESLAGVPGRLEPVRAGQEFAIFVDYAHTPDALEKLLETVRPLAAGRVIVIFGCGGDRDRKKRPMMGEIATRLSDATFATSDNPRSEDPLAILAEIEPGLRSGGAPYHIVPDRREAIRAALALAGKGDVVVIAGKGHEDYQILGSRRIWFDDRAIAHELMSQMLNAGGDSDRSELH
jgi:UDP-N-acetylmuramoyl-L-alanyl-D-glutamate--2,6-diaminopimelate ligase